MNYPYDNLENFTLGALIDRSFKLYADEPSFSKVSQKPLKYSEFYELIMQTKEMLAQNGISKGDKVLLLSENMPNWGAAYLAITYFGAVVVPVLPDFHVSDINHIIRHSEAKAVFVSEKQMQTLQECDKSHIRFVIRLDDLEIIKELTHKDYIAKIKQKTKSLTKRLSHKETGVKEDDLAAIIYTSGTTGHSKGVMLSHKNLVTNAMSAQSKVTILKSDIFLSILPLAHTFECTVGLLVPILHGSSVYYIDKAPTPSVLLKSFAEVRPTIILSVPLIMEKIYKSKILAKLNGSCITRNLYKVPYFRKKLNKIAGKKLLETFGGRLNFFVIGGAALSPFVEEFLDEAEFPYIIGYGLTETAPMLAGTRLDEKTKIGSTGSPLTGVEIKIDKQDEKSYEGEIIVRSPSVMIGYYKDDEKTKEVIKNGWFHTGDLGYIDQDGYIFISGRSKNLIVTSNGKNIYPEQIESIINKDEAVLDSLVLENDDKIVARVHLDYELIDKMFKADKTSESKVKESINNYLDDLRKNVNSQVASYAKINKIIEQIEPFVKTPTKKIKRYLYKN